MENKVIAKIAGKELTTADYDLFMQKVPADQRAYAENPQAKPYFVEQFLTQHLFAAYGEELKLEETEEFAKLMETMKMEILSQMAMAKVMEGIEVSEEDIKAFYDVHGEMFGKPEQVSAKHILVEDEAKANELKEAIEKGEITFEDAAKADSTCPSKEQGGNLGMFGRGQMVPEFEEAAFAAELETVVGPVKTQFGFHLIKVEAHTEPEIPAYEDVKDQVAQQAEQQIKGSYFREKTNELKEKFLTI